MELDFLSVDQKWVLFAEFAYRLPTDFGKSMKPQTNRVRLTATRVESFSCPPGKSQAFLWDTEAPALALRATPTGRKTYVFESRLKGTTIRINIGTLAATLDEARAKAKALTVLVDAGTDPREVERDRDAAKAAAKARAAMQEATVAEAWSVYLDERRPFWGVLHYQDHVKMAQPGGEARKRMKGVTTIAGPLAGLMSMRLADLNVSVVHAWAQTEVKTRPARARLALRQLKAFLGWCAAEPAYKSITDASAASGKKTREVAGTAKTKNDYIQREQLPAWFAHVRQIQNPVIAAYLQCLLLTGARREELAELKWNDVNFQWRGMTLKDKVEGQRAVPLTPYVAYLLTNMPRRNEWVFSSPTSESGRLTEPSIAHRQACAAAGLELTLHGLRRSFASLCEWLDIPGGISAQIQGHAPQGVREQNYIRRPLDLMRLHHEKIEAWILDQADVAYVRDVESGRLQIVK